MGWVKGEGEWGYRLRRGGEGRGGIDYAEVLKGTAKHIHSMMATPRHEAYILGVQDVQLWMN